MCKWFYSSCLVAPHGWSLTNDSTRVVPEEETMSRAFADNRFDPVSTEPRFMETTNTEQVFEWVSL